MASEKRVSAQPLRRSEEDAWRDYVDRHPRATVFHRLAWRRVLETLSGRDRYLTALRGDRLVGVLPLFEVRTLRLRRGLYSLPHTIFGGPIGDDAAAELALVAAAGELAGAVGAGDLVLKNRYPNLVDLPRAAGFVTFEKRLPGTGRDLLRTFNKGARHAVRSAVERHQLTVDVGAEVGELYELLAATYHRLGTPVYPRRFLEAIVDEFGSDAVLHVVRQPRGPVAGELSLRFRNVLTSIFSGEAAGARPLRPNHFKYFSLMERAFTEGVERFNFGRNRRSNPGILDFKSHLGFEPIPLEYQVVAKTSRPWAPDPNRGAFRVASRAWTRLPAGAARRLGPAIVRLFP